MGLEHFYQVIDRPEVDKLLGLTWPQFHRRYGWEPGQWGSAEEFLVDFALDDERARDDVDHVLKTRTLRWTMLRSSPKFFFMVEIAGQIPQLSMRCPRFWCEGLYQSHMFLGAASNAFLEGRISTRMLRAVVSLHGGPGEVRGLKLPSAKFQELEHALEPWEDPAGMFGWMRLRGYEDGYYQLGSRDARLVFEFLLQAWSENWACPYLSREIAAELPKSKRTAPRIRDNPVAESIMDWCKANKHWKARDLGLLRYFG